MDMVRCLIVDGAIKRAFILIVTIYGHIKTINIRLNWAKFFSVLHCHSQHFTKKYYSQFVHFLRILCFDRITIDVKNVQKSNINELNTETFRWNPSESFQR